MAGPVPLREGFQTEPAKSAEPVPIAPADVWPITVKLQHKPILDPTRGEIWEIVLRQPTGGDINKIGLPIKSDENLRFVFDDQKMHAMIGRLSGTLTPLLDQIDPRDWHTCAWKLFRFFLPSSAAWD